jgi:pumilio homology domain family member 6
MVPTKDRKDIIKVLKPYVVTMAKDEDAQFVLFTAFDVVEYVELLS